MADDGWSDADWDDDDWEESRADVDAALSQIAPPDIEVEAAGAERLRRLEALKARSVSVGGGPKNSAAVPPPLVAGLSCTPTSAAEQHALSESDGNVRIGEAASPPRVRGPGEEDVQYKFYASGARYEGPLDPVTSQPHGEFGVFFYVCGHRYEGPWEQGEKHGERGTFYCAPSCPGPVPNCQRCFPFLLIGHTWTVLILQSWNGVLCCLGIAWSTVANGSRYEGGWSRNKRHGLGVQFSPVRGSHLCS